MCGGETLVHSCSKVKWESEGVVALTILTPFPIIMSFCRFAIDASTSSAISGIGVGGLA